MNSTQWFNSTSSIVSQRGNLRRGNTIVLVAGILVLLVIIATAYVTRTGGERITAKVTSDAGLIDDTHRVISQMLADEIGLSLFPRPLVAGNAASATAPAISPADPGLWTTAAPHLYPPPFESDRYEPDANYPWNFPPYNDVAWTNWPDDGPGENTVTATK